MKVAGGLAAAAARIGIDARDLAAAAEPVAETTGRALVPVNPIEDRPARVPLRRGSASFLAQLIANDQQFPQTRDRRRAEPREVLAAYGAVVKLTKKR